MFLITTADQRFWKKDENILFIGEWCKIYDQRHIWSELNYKVLPYHWDDREKLYLDYLYLDTIYEKYLALLTNKLNNLHEVDYSLRYWRIVVGLWLYYFIEILFDRYLSIKSASNSGLVSDTWICPQSIERWAPNDFATFEQWVVCSDEYNNYLYSRMIQTLGEMPFSVLDIKTFPTSDNLPKTKESHFNLIIKDLFGIFEKYSSSQWNQVVFICTYLDIWDRTKLQLSLNQMPYFEPQHFVPESVPVKQPMRKKLIFKEGKNEFESILDWIIAEQIPKVYVEGYADLHKKSLDLFPKRPKVIFTVNAYYGNTLFQLWSAYQVEKGTKLIGSQHGGHYGSGLWSASESHQIRICDRFYTWGWETNETHKVRPLATGKFNGVKGLTPNPKGTILMVEATSPRYSYWMYSNTIGPQMLDYINDQYRFVQSVSAEVHENLLLRLNPIDYGWNEASRWRDNCPTLKQYQGEKSIYQQLKTSRLFIGTYNGTTYLETFSANYPTVLFWNPKHWELRPSAKPFFDELRRVGILHDTPESAAKKVNEIFKDPQLWWHQKEIQETLNDFNYHFLRTSDDWLREWKHEFQAIIAEQKVNI